jgi:transcription initiation factor TFIIH subunit 3
MNMRTADSCAAVTLAGAEQQQQQLQEAVLSGGMSRALCYANRLSGRYGTSSRHKAKPRILSIVCAADTPLQYIPLMNCIFAAQHSNVALDAVVLGPADSAFLQQAAHITGGIYQRPQQPTGLLQYLLGVFSADTATREALSSSAGTQAVDFRCASVLSLTHTDNHNLVGAMRLMVFDWPHVHTGQLCHLHTSPECSMG